MLERVYVIKPTAARGQAVIVILPSFHALIQFLYSVLCFHLCSTGKTQLVPDCAFIPGNTSGNIVGTTFRLASHVVSPFLSSPHCSETMFLEDAHVSTSFVCQTSGSSVLSTVSASPPLNSLTVSHQIVSCY